VQFQVTDQPVIDDATLLAVGVSGTKDAPTPSGALDAVDIDLVAALLAVEFAPDAGTVARLHLPGGGSLLAVGLGETPDVHAVRRLGHEAGRAAADREAVAVVLPAGADDVAASQALAEGVVLGAYRFATYKADMQPASLAQVTVVGPADPAALRVGDVVARAQCLARDLVNTPPNDKRPPALAARAVELASAVGLDVRVLDGDALRAGGYGGLLAVGRGSEVDSQLVELRWSPDAAKGDHVALVGKGITFDTGGISLKPSSSMETMKMDMGGAAATLATMLAIAELELPVHVTGLLCLAENMPSGTATRVSDVYTALGGTTVEVMNTDAEGRLVLADGIVHAGRLGVDLIVDLATLTGAAKVALGDEITVLMADDDELAAALTAAGAAASEPMWRLPVATDHYREKLDSDVADIKNTGGRAAGSITAGLFLHHFVPDGTQWAHLDIAGTAWADAPIALSGKGGTGVPVRTLVGWLRGR
jgi:leucyl aminopeptidase